MTTQASSQPNGHLQYYKEHGISPVHYEMDDFQAHLNRRDSLYRSLGLPPALFKGCNVLEVAPGTGQNSLYVATCLPASYDLVEPNPAGLEVIRKSYAELELPHTAPTLHAQTFQEFQTDRRFDVVLCENWLGSLPNELELLAKLASLVAPGGVLVLTMVPLSGFFPNVMRKLLALRLIDKSQSFAEQTQAMVDVFGAHLATMPAMTRSHRDWVQDCMLNPHYLNVALPLDAILETVGSELEILATFPRFTPDWRWFKGLTGNDRKFNETIREAHQANTHSFVDHRQIYAPRAAERNEALEMAFSQAHEKALAWQQAYENDSRETLNDLTDDIGVLLAEIGAGLGEIDGALGAAIDELRLLWCEKELHAQSVRDMKLFGGLFGRETIYVSLTRPAHM